MVFEVLATIGAVLGIFNTIILLRRALIHKEDLKVLIDVLTSVAKLSPSKIDDKLLEKVKRIAEEHCK